LTYGSAASSFAQMFKGVSSFLDENLVLRKKRRLLPGYKKHVKAKPPGSLGT